MAKDHSTVSSDETRRAALEMLGEGVATLSEVARLAGVDRQLVRHWAMRAGIDVGKTRAARLREIWRSKVGKHR
jgi:transposase-like protein